MFDGEMTSDAARETLERQALADSLERLFARFDPLAAGGAVTPEEERDLRAMASIFDLETTGGAGEVWGRLRPVLSRQTAPAGDAAASAPGDPLTIMVVEDDAEAAAALTEALDAAGHGVIGPFHSGETALAAAGLHALDLALLDINLSGDLSGVELARALKSAWGVPVMFLSGDVTQAALHAGLAVALITKPYRTRDVLAAIDAVASRPAA